MWEVLGEILFNIALESLGIFAELIWHKSRHDKIERGKERLGAIPQSSRVYGAQKQQVHSAYEPNGLVKK